MSLIIRIIKENDLKLPIGTQLHYNSFFDNTKKSESNNTNVWNSIGVYNYQDVLGNVFCIKESEIYPKYKDIYKNVIALSNLKFAIEGDEYWKVFSHEDEAKYHKLENNNKDIALCFKPYKDTVQSNTSSMYRPSIQRFKTEFEAIEYIEKVKENL